MEYKLLCTCACVCACVCAGVMCVCVSCLPFVAVRRMFIAIHKHAWVKLYCRYNAMCL